VQRNPCRELRKCVICSSQTYAQSNDGRLESTERMMISRNKSKQRKTCTNVPFCIKPTWAASEVNFGLRIICVPEVWNNGLIHIWTDAVMAYFNVLPKQSLWETEESKTNPVSIERDLNLSLKLHSESCCCWRWLGMWNFKKWP
jgi:hypothetical protein